MAWAEKRFEERMLPSIDNIYKQTFSNIKNIRRSNRNSDDAKILFMDKELAIDTFLTFENGSQLTFQEKTLKPFQRHWQQFTFEYYNNPKTKEEGEWFKLAAMFYFFGYGHCSWARKCNKKCEDCNYLNRHKEFWLIDVALLKIFLKSQFSIKYMERKWLRQNPPPAKANFFAIPFKVFPDEIFLVRKSIKNISKITALKVQNDRAI